MNDCYYKVTTDCVLQARKFSHIFPKSVICNQMQSYASSLDESGHVVSVLDFHYESLQIRPGETQSPPPAKMGT